MRGWVLGRWLDFVRNCRWVSISDPDSRPEFCHSLRGEGIAMTHRVSALIVLFALAAPAGAQQGDLTDVQLRGRQVFAQSCGVCHLQPSLGVKTYGPPLNKTSAAGSDAAMRAFIANGTDRMPAFKYYLKPAEIDAIIAYVRTVPAPAAPSQSSGKGKADEHD